MIAAILALWSTVCPASDVERDDSPIRMLEPVRPCAQLACTLRALGDTFADIAVRLHVSRDFAARLVAQVEGDFTVLLAMVAADVDNTAAWRSPFYRTAQRTPRYADPCIPF